MNIISKEIINKGWSSDIKYCIKDEYNNKYLLRISSIDQYEKKLVEFDYLKKLEKIGLSMCKPIEFGTCDDGVYIILSWIEGVDAQEYILNLSNKEQYEYGIIAGKELLKIHSLKAPSNIFDWEEKFNKKIDRKIIMYEDCPIKIDKANNLIEYINNNRYLLKNRNLVFHHGDYHIGNMMINENKELVIIDFNRADFGDPYEEFNRIVWCAQASSYFASGIVDGYFNNDVPEDFWRVLALYISSNTLSSIPWAIPFGKEEIEVMINQSKDVLRWYDDMNTYIPSWYKKNKSK